MHNQDTPKGLENLSTYEPKPALWDNIEAQLDKKEDKKIIYWRWVRGIAASIALVMVIQFFITKNDDLTQLNKERLAEVASESGYGLSVEKQPDEEPAPQAVGLDTSTGFTQVVESGDRTESNTTITASADSVVILNNHAFGYTTDATKQQSATWTDANQTTIYGNYKPTLAPSYSSEPGGAKFNIITEGDQIDFTLNANDAAFATSQGYVNQSHINQGTTSYTWNVQTTAATADAKSNGSGKVYTVENANTYEVIGYDSDDDYISSYEDIEADYDGIDEAPIDWEFGDANNRADKKAISSPGAYNVSIEPFNTESYYPLIENEYENPLEEPLSTFGIDVDNASYSVMRTKLRSNRIVPKDAVRVEEFVNYFDYNYPQPTTNRPFSVNMENADCPWNKNHQLVRIGLKGKDIDYTHMQNSNLVFLIDVSGSMSSENKLSLVKKSLKLLVDQMGRNDRIAIVTYAGAAGLALPSTRCDEKDLIKKKIDRLDAGGSTAGGQGIKLAYKVAYENLIADGNNRVIMCTDGDFNVGASSDKAMKELIIENRNKGIFITACGFGMGNYQDSKMETIADNGNGNYFYIDTYRESEKVFKRDLRATLFTIAKDVKIQVEFNPKHVKAYRLIGYENRKMPPQDFNDDTKDGGELGAGHTVTALYEIIPASSNEEIPGRIELKYQKPTTTSTSEFGDELLTVKLRYKKPNGNVSTLYETTQAAGTKPFYNASEDFRFAAGVALFGQQLRQSKFIDLTNFDLARQITTRAKGNDPNGDRQELIDLIHQASNTYRIYTEH